MTMTKRTRQSIIEPLMLEKLTIKTITQRLHDEYNETITSETVRKDVLEIKGELDQEKPGWDEMSEEALLRETIRRGFDKKDKTVTVRDANAARKDLAALHAENKAKEEAGLIMADLPDHERQYPMTEFEIALAHMPKKELAEWILKQYEAAAALPE